MENAKDHQMPHHPAKRGYAQMHLLALKQIKHVIYFKLDVSLMEQVAQTLWVCVVHIRELLLHVTNILVMMETALHQQIKLNKEIVELGGVLMLLKH